jgi:DnaJ-class molecular chaperone
MSKMPDYCSICGGSGAVPETRYENVPGQYGAAYRFHVTLTGHLKACPGCDGVGESERSKGNVDK